MHPIRLNEVEEIEQVSRDKLHPGCKTSNEFYL